MNTTDSTGALKDLLTSTHPRNPLGIATKQDNPYILEAAADLLRNPLFRALKDDKTKEKFLRASGIVDLSKVYKLAYDTNVRPLKYARNTQAQAIFKGAALLLLATGSTTLVLIYLFRYFYFDRIVDFHDNFSKPFYREKLLPRLQMENDTLIYMKNIQMVYFSRKIENYMSSSAEKLETVASIITSFVES